METCLHLLGQEKDERIQMHLAYALLAHFAEEGIEAARRLLLGREIDFDSRDLWDSLLETCTLTGAQVPRVRRMVGRDRRETEEHRKRIKELEGDPTRLMVYASGKLAGKTDAELDKLLRGPPRPRRIARRSPPRSPGRSRKSGGTNDAPAAAARSSSIAAGAIDGLSPTWRSGRARIGNRMRDDQGESSPGGLGSPSGGRWRWMAKS